MVQNRIAHSVGARNGASRNTVAVQEHENGQRFQHVGQRFPKEREVGAVSSSPIQEPSAGHKCQDHIPLTGSHAKRMNPALEESMHSNYDAQQRARLEQQRKEQEARNHAREVLQRDRENATFSARGKNGLKTRPRYSVKASMQENRKPGVQASTRSSSVTSSQNAPDAFDQIFECQVKTLEDLNKPKDGTPKQEYPRSTSTNSSPLQKCRNICPSVPAPIALGGRRLHQIEQSTVENLSSAAGGRGSTVEQKFTNYVRVRDISPPKSDPTTTRSGRQGANSSKKLSESRDASLPLESSPKSRPPLSSQRIGSDQRKQPRVAVSPSSTGRQESPQDGWRVCERDRQTEAKSHRSRSRHRDEISPRRHREHRDTSSSQPDLREIVSINHGRERYRSPLEASSHRLRLPLHNQPSQRHRERRDTQSTLPNLRGRDADSNTLSSRSSASSTVRQQDSRQSECWKVETSLESETLATHIRRDLRFDVRPDASAKDFESFETGKFCSIDDQRGQAQEPRSRSEERLFKTMQTVFDTPLKGTYSNHMEKVDLEHALHNQAANNRELLKVKNSPKKEQPTSHWASRWDVRPTATDAFSVASEGARKRTLSASANVKSGPKTSEENVDKQEYGHKVQKKLEGATENGNGENDLEEGDVGAEYEIISVAPGQVRYRSKWTTAERYHSKNQNEFSMEMDDGDDQNIEWDSRLYVSNQPDLTNESAEKINRSEVLGHTEIDEKEYLADGKMGTNSVDEEPLIHEETDSSMETDESPSPGPGIAGDVDNRRPLRSAFQKLTEGCDSKNEGVNAVKDSSMEADDLFAENVQTVWNLCEPQQTENDNNVLEMDCEKSDSDSDASTDGWESDSSMETDDSDTDNQITSKQPTVYQEVKDDGALTEVLEFGNIGGDIGSLPRYSTSEGGSDYSMDRDDPWTPAAESARDTNSRRSIVHQIQEKRLETFEEDTVTLKNDRDLSKVSSVDSALMVKTSVIPSGTVSVSGNIKSGLVAKGTKAMCPKAQESMLHFKKKNSPGKYNRGHLWKASKSQLKRSETTKKATLRNMLKSGQLDLPLDSVSEPSNSECKPSGSSMETGNIPSAISAIGSSANHQWQPSKTTVCNGMLGQSSNRKDDSKDVEGRRQPTKIHPECHAAKSDSVGSKPMKPGQIPDNDSEWNSNFRESDYLCSTIPAIGSTTNHQWTPRKAAVSPDTNMNGMLEDVDDRLHDDTSEDVIDQRIELDSCDYYASINDSEWTSEDDFDDSDDEPMTPMRLSPIWERCEQEDSAEEESEDETLSVMEYLRGRQYKKYLPKKDKPVQATIEPVREQVKVMKPAEPPIFRLSEYDEMEQALESIADVRFDHMEEDEE